MNPHLPLLVLEKIATGERGRNETYIKEHLEQCEKCSARLERLLSHDSEFQQTHPVASMLGKFSREAEAVDMPRSRRGFYWLGLAGIPAAAMVILLVLLLLPKTPPGDDIRFRGTATTLQAYRLDGGSLTPLTSGQRPLPGTLLRFRAQSGIDGYVCIFHKEGERIRTLYPDKTSIESPKTPWFVPGTYALTESGKDDYVGMALFDRPVDCAKHRSWMEKPDKGYSNVKGHAIIKLPRAKSR